MSKPIVYIASPYTSGDPAVNTHFQCKMFDKMMDDGFVWPVAPLWSHFQHTVFPRPYQDWIDYDLAMLAKYDACIRLSSVNDRLKYGVSQSSGADREVEAFREAGKPVFSNLQKLYAWAVTQA